MIKTRKRKLKTIGPGNYSGRLKVANPKKTPEQEEIKRKAMNSENRFKFGKSLLHWDRESGEFIKRYPTWIELFKNWGEDILYWILFPFIWIVSQISRRIFSFFYPKSNLHHNGVFGPGGYTSFERHFSWGKLAVLLVVFLGVLILIFK